ncbi:hypothetical protein ACFYXS_28590 [Streptomyces sp. NPDC002574]|uniref:hypothetical protein n=1 Tax=Streptomyces sp. NPDC002574 TaxID=3364652 RepID=UPI003698E0CF
MRSSATRPTIVCTISTHDANDSLDLEVAGAASTTALPDGTAAGTPVGTDASAVHLDH